MVMLVREAPLILSSSRGKLERLIALKRLQFRSIGYFLRIPGHIQHQNHHRISSARSVSKPQAPCIPFLAPEPRDFEGRGLTTIKTMPLSQRCWSGMSNASPSPIRESLDPEHTQCSRRGIFLAISGKVDAVVVLLEIAV